MEPNSHNQHDLTGPHYRRTLPRVRLEIRRGKAQNKIRTVTGPVYLIGTASDCDLVLVEGDSQTEATKVEVWRAAVSKQPMAIIPSG